MKERNAVLIEDNDLEQAAGGDYIPQQLCITVVDYHAGLKVWNDVWISSKWSGNSLKRVISRRIKWDLSEFDLYRYETKLNDNLSVEDNGIRYGDRLDARPRE